MQTQRFSSALATAALSATVLLSSCSLPPGMAWREIQRGGLIPFIANGMSAPKAQPGQPPKMMLTSNNAASTRVTQPALPPVRSLASAPTPAVTSAKLPPAYAVKGLTGYVRTPFTNPPRLVDVRGMSAGAKVACPYTQRYFIVPSGAVQMAAAAKPQAKPEAPAPALAMQPKPQPAPAPASPVKAGPPSPSAQPQVAAAPKPEPKPAPAPAVKPAPKPPETPKVATTPPAPKTTPAKVESTPPPPPAPAAQVAQRLPFGTPIPGRAGFVNSPYAEKHQLVDVTGLSIGTEVKCPYTGKLFRVPPQQQAKK